MSHARLPVNFESIDSINQFIAEQYAASPQVLPERIFMNLAGAYVESGTRYLYPLVSVAEQFQRGSESKSYADQIKSYSAIINMRITLHPAGQPFKNWMHVFFSLYPQFITSALTEKTLRIINPKPHQPFLSAKVIKRAKGILKKESNAPMFILSILMDTLSQDELNLLPGRLNYLVTTRNNQLSLDPTLIQNVFHSFKDPKKQIEYVKSLMTQFMTQLQTSGKDFDKERMSGYFYHFLELPLFVPQTIAADILQCILAYFKAVVEERKTMAGTGFLAMKTLVLYKKHFSLAQKKTWQEILDVLIAQYNIFYADLLLNNPSLLTQDQTLKLIISEMKKLMSDDYNVGQHFITRLYAYGDLVDTQIVAEHSALLENLIIRIIKSDLEKTAPLILKYFSQAKMKALLYSYIDNIEKIRERWSEENAFLNIVRKTKLIYPELFDRELILILTNKYFWLRKFSHYSDTIFPLLKEHLSPQELNTLDAQAKLKGITFDEAHPEKRWDKIQSYKIKIFDKNTEIASHALSHYTRLEKEKKDEKTDAVMRDLALVVESESAHHNQILRLLPALKQFITESNEDTLANALEQIHRTAKWSEYPGQFNIHDLMQLIPQFKKPKNQRGLLDIFSQTNKRDIRREEDFRGMIPVVTEFRHAEYIINLLLERAELLYQRETYVDIFPADRSGISYLISDLLRQMPDNIRNYFIYSHIRERLENAKCDYVFLHLLQIYYLASREQVIKYELTKAGVMTDSQPAIMNATTNHHYF